MQDTPEGGQLQTGALSPPCPRALFRKHSDSGRLCFVHDMQVARTSPACSQGQERADRGSMRERHRHRHQHRLPWRNADVW